MPLLALTPAEQEVVRLLVAGRTTAAVAKQRGTSINTVRVQIQMIYIKLDITHRAELIVWAIANGYGPSTATVQERRAAA